jgi:hypothetical protein
MAQDAAASRLYGPLLAFGPFAWRSVRSGRQAASYARKGGRLDDRETLGFSRRPWGT